MADDNSANTIFGLASAFVLSNIPPEWLLTVDKLIYGAIAALIAGFLHKAGGWIWSSLKRKITHDPQD